MRISPAALTTALLIASIIASSIVEATILILQRSISVQALFCSWPRSISRLWSGRGGIFGFSLKVESTRREHSQATATPFRPVRLRFGKGDDRVEADTCS